MKRIALAAIALGLAAPAFATGKMTCDAPQAQWKGEAALTESLTKQG